MTQADHAAQVARQLATATQKDLGGQLEASLKLARKEEPPYHPGKVEPIEWPVAGAWICVDSNYEPGMPCGSGNSSDEALMDYCEKLIEMLESRRNRKVAR